MPLDQNYFDDSATMSFGDHLEELRRRIIFAILPPFPLIFVLWPFSDDLLDLIIHPLRRALLSEGLDDRLQVLSPPEALLTQLKVCVIGAIILTAPWILWQAWLFIRPGLYRQERRFVYLLIPGSGVMTAAGLAVFYFIMLPLVLIVLVRFGVALDDELTLDQLRQDLPAIEVAPEEVPRLPFFEGIPTELAAGMWWLTPDHELMIVVPERRGLNPNDPPVDEMGSPLPIELTVRRIRLIKSTALSQEFRLTTYVSFVLVLALGMVIAFQLPLVMLLLGWLNLASVSYLRKNRKYALFGSAVLGAFLTPADPWSMFAMMIPLYLLFEFGVLLMALLPAHRVAGGPRSADQNAQSSQSDVQSRSDQSEEKDRF